jgi:hypothetical protein
VSAILVDRAVFAVCLAARTDLIDTIVLTVGRGLTGLTIVSQAHGVDALGRLAAVRVFGAARGKRHHAAFASAAAGHSGVRGSAWAGGTGVDALPAFTGVGRAGFGPVATGIITAAVGDDAYKEQPRHDACCRTHGYLRLKIFKVTNAKPMSLSKPR